MPTPILMPALSPTMEEGTLAKWNVKEGDKVSSGDVIAEIETDKATMEVEAVDEGVIGKILVPAGTEGVKVNAPIAELLDDGESAAPAQKKNGAAPKDEGGAKKTQPHPEVRAERASKDAAFPPLLPHHPVRRCATTVPAARAGSGRSEGRAGPGRDSAGAVARARAKLRAS